MYNKSRHPRKEVIILTFGEWLQERRLALNLTQEEAAKRADLTRAMWAKLEADNTGTRRATVRRIAMALESNVDEALERAGFNSSGSFAPDAELASIVDTVPAE